MKNKIKSAIHAAAITERYEKSHQVVALTRHDWGQLEYNELYELLVYADKLGVEMIFVPDSQETDS